MCFADHWKRWKLWLTYLYLQKSIWRLLSGFLFCWLSLIRMMSLQILKDSPKCKISHHSARLKSVQACGWPGGYSLQMRRVFGWRTIYCYWSLKVVAPLLETVGEHITCVDGSRVEIRISELQLQVLWLQVAVHLVKPSWMQAKR